MDFINHVSRESGQNMKHVYSNYRNYILVKTRKDYESMIALIKIVVD